MALIGIDLHTDSFYVVRTRSTAEGIIRTEKKYELHGQSWEVFTQSLKKDDYLLVEATTNAFWFHDRVKPFVKKCFILNVNAVRFAGNKTDSIDAQRLLDLLSYYVHVKGISELPAVYVPRPEVRQLRTFLSTYRVNKRIETQIKNRIHSLFKQAGVVTTKRKLFTKAGWKMAIESSSLDLRIHVKLFFQQLVEVKKTTEAVKDLILDLGMKTFTKEIKLLLSIPGFSAFTAIVLLADIDSVDRFSSAKKFCAYLRTAPRVKGSNNTTHMGPVGRHSRSMTCTLLTQSVQYFKLAGPHFSSFYARVRLGKSVGKSRIALIRKMLVSAYYMLKREELFYWVDPNNYERKKARIIREVAHARQRSLVQQTKFEDIGEKSA